MYVCTYSHVPTTSWMFMWIYGMLLLEYIYICGSPFNFQNANVAAGAQQFSIVIDTNERIKKKNVLFYIHTIHWLHNIWAHTSSTQSSFNLWPVDLCQRFSLSACVCVCAGERVSQQAYVWESVWLSEFRVHRKSSIRFYLLKAHSFKAHISDVLCWPGKYTHNTLNLSPYLRMRVYAHVSVYRGIGARVCVCIYVLYMYSYICWDGAFPQLHIHTFCIMLSVIGCRMSLFVCFLLVFFARRELWTMRRIDRRRVYICIYFYIFIYNIVVAAFETHLIIVMLCIVRAVESKASTISHYTLQYRIIGWSRSTHIIFYGGEKNRQKQK